MGTGKRVPVGACGWQQSLCPSSAGDAGPQDFPQDQTHPLWFEHSACLTENGSVYTWGKGDKGQLGHGTDQDQKTPHLVHALEGKVVTKVHCGVYVNAALTERGEVYMWGGMVVPGTSQETTQTLPRLIEFFQGKHVTHIGLGGFHAAVVLGTTWERHSKYCLWLGALGCNFSDWAAVLMGKGEWGPARSWGRAEPEHSPAGGDPRRRRYKECFVWLLPYCSVGSDVRAKTERVPAAVIVFAIIGSAPQLSGAQGHHSSPSPSPSPSSAHLLMRPRSVSSDFDDLPPASASASAPVGSLILGDALRPATPSAVSV
eukprot:CAMPEP_0184336502 /NCGR_PEP_ID=MMETSP1089-20130417/4774_1 /TAXON_ID=38269 ORGANISM="Gloeochaete wittrockiana, Strain SAG46.84" /NCGR_SAMPLE_ID=MMETSP1089 /ASSEMBLY_ACC=CAM_ASM_000445 /LENGTH=314 /DNA_ID=CAMNT_0026661539 /DNA_START=62 /DNA_END=1004 /DNA_ORIENTATION=-